MLSGTGGRPSGFAVNAVAASAILCYLNRHAQRSASDARHRRIIVSDTSIQRFFRAPSLKAYCPRPTAMPMTHATTGGAVQSARNAYSSDCRSERMHAAAKVRNGSSAEPKARIAQDGTGRRPRARIRRSLGARFPRARGVSDRPGPRGRPRDLHEALRPGSAEGSDQQHRSARILVGR